MGLHMINEPPSVFCLPFVMLSPTCHQNWCFPSLNAIELLACFRAFFCTRRAGRSVNVWYVKLDNGFVLFFAGIPIGAGEELLTCYSRTVRTHFPFRFIFTFSPPASVFHM